MAAQRRKKRGGILPVLVTMVLLVLVAVLSLIHISEPTRH